MILNSNGNIAGFRPVPKTGVIFVMTEAAKLGYKTERCEWSNLGQGAPETTSLPGSPERIKKLKLRNTRFRIRSSQWSS